MILKDVTPRPLHFGTGISTVKMFAKFEIPSFYSSSTKKVVQRETFKIEKDKFESEKARKQTTNKSWKRRKEFRNNLKGV